MSDNASIPNPDAPRPVATAGDNDFTLPIEHVSERYAAAGHPRTIRTLQRYCASGHLDAQKIATTLGDKYLVTPLSVARHIGQIQELSALDTVATRRDQPGPVATHIAPTPEPSVQGPHTPSDRDTGRHAPRAEGDVSRYVARLEKEVEQAKDERDFLREQIDRKDRTIDSLIERDRETNFLIRGLQNLIPRLAMGRGEPDEPPEQPPIQ